jgi:hypothetical protein
MRTMKLGVESQNIQGMNILLAEQLVSKNYEARSGNSKYSRYEYFVSRKPFKNQKAVEEIGKPLKKIFSDFLEIGKPLKKIKF